MSRSDYEPFGAPLSNGRERLSFIGKEQDNESSLGDYGVRKYDPTLGRFMSVDALSDLMPGSSPFHYCFNNPLILRDPSGLIGEIGGDGIPRFTTGEVVVYGERDNSSEDVIRDRKLEWMAKRAAAAAADMAPRAQGGESSVLSGTDKAGYGLSAFGFANGAKTTIIDYAVKSGSGQAGLRAELQVLGKTGTRYLSAAKGLSFVAGVAGVALTGIDAYNKGQWQSHHTADVLIGIGSLYLLTGPAGWAIGGSYFLLDIGIKSYTGRSITENLFDHP